jgi:tripartite-type tricarboxylate transporter receptor subunit TctC
MKIIDLAPTPVRRRTALSLGALALGALALPGRAEAADYPTKPIRIVVPYAPGGTTDIATRMVGEPLGRALGQPVVVDNKPGANSIVGAGAVATSPPDGYAPAMVIGAHAANATLYAGRLPFDPVASFAPVSHVVTAPLVLASSGRLPVRTLGELIAHAKTRPGAVNYGSSGVGAAAHLTMEDLKLRTGIDLVHVPYRGTQPALQDLIAGNIGALFDTYSTLKPQFDAGTIRPLGIASAQRAASRPSSPPSPRRACPTSFPAPGASCWRRRARPGRWWSAFRPRSPGSSATRRWPRGSRRSASSRSGTRRTRPALSWARRSPAGARSSAPPT